MELPGRPAPRGNRFGRDRGTWFRGQGTGNRGQVSGSDQELLRGQNHCSKHPAYLVILLDQLALLLLTDVAAVEGEVERRVGFIVFSITIRELAQKMQSIASLRPSF